MKWTEINRKPPPDGITVMTKIHDERGPRKEQELKRQGQLWFFPDMSMRIYYQPTHWKLDRPMWVLTLKKWWKREISNSGVRQVSRQGHS